MSNIQRKLASIRKITEIRPIPGADAIECAYVGGWPVVTKKGEYKVGDLAVYCELDSWIPHDLAPWLSKGKEPREYNGVKGERLRSVRLRGQISQGLLLPTSILDERGLWPLAGNPVGHDLTAQLGIQKWEAPIPACLAGQVRGNFPSFIPKTDQERCLLGSTVVDTDKGPLTLEEICEGGCNVSVKSFCTETGEVEMRKVTGSSVMDETDQDWFCLTTNKGKKLVATGNHRVWCEDIKAYRRVRDIKPGQMVLSCYLNHEYCLPSLRTGP